MRQRRKVCDSDNRRQAGPDDRGAESAPGVEVSLGEADGDFLARGGGPMLATALLHAPGLAAYLVLVNSMTADQVDYDKSRNGRRREWVDHQDGRFAFVHPCRPRPEHHRFDATLGANQPPRTVLWMRILFCAIPALGTGTALLLLRGYSLTRERVVELQAALTRRRVPAT